MTRRVIAAAAVWAVAVATWWLFIGGGHVQSCLGPLGVTPEQCRVALGLPPLTAWDQLLDGPAPAILFIAIGWVVIGFTARMVGGASGRRRAGG